MPPLTVDEIRDAVHSVARELMSSIDEPIPPFDSRYAGRLASAISAPFQGFEGHESYPSLPEKASALFYFMTKATLLKTATSG